MSGPSASGMVPPGAGRRASGLAEAVALLTVLGRARRPGPEAVPFFSLVGLGLGAALGALWWAVARVLPAIAAAAVVVGADLALTGMLHLDGVVDAADGLLAHLTRDRRLEVMAEPAVGAFGVGAALLVTLLRFAALASTRPAPLAGALLLLGGIWTASRAAAGAATVLLPYARSGLAGGGLVSVLLGDRRSAAGALGGAAAGAGVAVASLVGWRVEAAGGLAPSGAGLAAAFAVLAGVLAGAAGVLLLARRRLGGYTGDVLGAAISCGEAVGLVLAAVRW